ncbi:MAG: aldose 1-epimerase family protein [Oscillospiraceae bacterium]|jgi:galactose mutarotase-like enzyme|nr:aldose 1-epimerase family protein [Oscillospiraceae bacterium]
MLYHIENEALFCAVDSFGAELHSLQSRRTKTEYLWQGDPAVWAGQAPILFPVVGRLQGDSYAYDGRSYSLAKHGFARKQAFELLARERDRVAFQLCDSEATRVGYPFAFALQADYRLTGSTLAAAVTVRNTGDVPLPFSLGAHPAFNCAMGDILRFSQPETLCSLCVNTESYLTGEAFSVLDAATELVLHPHLFDNDALIFQNVQSEFITLLRSGREALRFALGGAPALGLWAKPGAPYVCIEPWFGISDGLQGAPDIRQKKGVLLLAPGERFTQSWTAETMDE